MRQDYDPAAPLDTLKEHPENPRRGDDAAVADSVDVFGFYGAIIAQRSTGYILAGHTRRRVLDARGEATAPVLWLDVDDATARRILLADNRTAELATWDERALSELLAELGQQDDGALLAGTGFTPEELAALTEDLELPQPPPSAAQYDENRNAREAWAETYETTTLRQVTLVMQAEEYDPLVAALERLRMALGLPSFAAVVQRLVAEQEARMVNEGVPA